MVGGTRYNGLLDGGIPLNKSVWDSMTDMEKDVDQAKYCFERAAYFAKAGRIKGGQNSVDELLGLLSKIGFTINHNDFTPQDQQEGNNMKLFPNVESNNDLKDYVNIVVENSNGNVTQRQPTYEELDKFPGLSVGLSDIIVIECAEKFMAKFLYVCIKTIPGFGGIYLMLKLEDE